MARFNDGSHVRDTFASAFKTIVNGLAKANATVKFKLNVQGGESVSIYCDHAFAFDYITFMDSLDSEILEHGVAIVIATDYKTDIHDTTVFVVCDDEL